MSFFVVGMGLALAVLFVGASFAAAVDPLAPLLTLALAYAGGRTLLRAPGGRRMLRYGIGLIALVTIPLGLLTHGSITDLGPYPAEPVADTLSDRTVTASVSHRGGTLIAYATTDASAPVLAFTRADRVRWASALPTDRGVTGLRDLTVSPLLWRYRVDFYAEGWDAPGWLYVWRWGGVQEMHLLRRSS
jgi:hypothetical protein